MSFPEDIIVKQYNSQRSIDKLKLRENPAFHLAQMQAHYMNLYWLRGFWNFSSVNASSSPNDLSGNGLALTSAGSASITLDTTGFYNYVSLNGTNQYYYRADEANLELSYGACLMCWVYWNSFTSDAGLISKWSTTGSSGGYMLYTKLSGGNYYVSMAIENSAGTFKELINTSVALQTGKWYFCVGSYKQDELKVFVNGTWDTLTTAIPAPPLRDNAIQIQIGAWSAANKYTAARIAFPAISGYLYNTASFENIWRVGRRIFHV